MADPRDTARTWLVDAIHAADCDCGQAWHLAYYTRSADAILNASGVKVEVDRIKRLPQELGDDEPLEIRNPPTGMRPTHTQVVIRLPAQAIEEAP